MPVEARAYPRPLPNPEWLGKLTEEIIEPDLPIVDPHHPSGIIRAADICLKSFWPMSIRATTS